MILVEGKERESKMKIEQGELMARSFAEDKRFQEKGQNVTTTDERIPTAGLQHAKFVKLFAFTSR